tara:strand:- start:226 stop:702 length:477 start_codon:yes stop_codon:yes gene_type:complete
MKRQSFTFYELLLTIAVVVIIMAVLPVIEKIVHKPKPRGRCTGNLKQIGLSMLMYSGDNDGYFPTIVPGAQSGPDAFNFIPLVTGHYIGDGRVFNCPSRSLPATGAFRSAYAYMGSGIKDNNDNATEVSIARDESGNHPGDEWRNYLFVDGHVEGIRP